MKPLGSLGNAWNCGKVQAAVEHAPAGVRVHVSADSV